MSLSDLKGRAGEILQRYEDPKALLAGPDGLEVIRRLVSKAQELLLPGGTLAFEMGMGQYETVRDLMQASGYENISARRDLARIDRIAIGNTPSA